MRKRSRVRRILKWAGTTTSLILLAALLLGVIRSVVWVSWLYGPASDEELVIALHGGALDVIKMGLIRFPSHPSDFGWPLTGEWIWLLKASKYKSARRMFQRILVPLWLPLLLSLIPTAYLWYKDRRIPRGHCQKCGYDLTGNASGVCPECGTSIAVDEDTD